LGQNNSALSKIDRAWLALISIVAGFGGGLLATTVNRPRPAPPPPPAVATPQPMTQEERLKNKLILLLQEGTPDDQRWALTKLQKMVGGQVGAPDGFEPSFNR
jgi:hypothetical protein